MYKIDTTYFSKTLILALCLSLVSFSPVVTNAQTSLDASQFNNEEQYRQYLFSRLAELQAQLVVLLKLKSKIDEGYQLVSSSKTDTRVQPNPHFMQVSTMSPLSVGRSTAKLFAEVDKGSAEKAEVWFQYGTGESLNKNTKSTRVISTRKVSYKEEAQNLKSDTKYSYRVVIEDEDGYRQYGQVRTFTTPSSATVVSFSGSPLVETNGVVNITSYSAELSGFVSMNDFDEGILFFTYGSDIGDINDVEDYDTFEEIPTKRGVTGKQITDKEFTGRDIVKQRVSGFKRATKYYYNVCVEYRDGRSKIRCSETESFVTLN